MWPRMTINQIEFPTPCFLWKLPFSKLQKWVDQVRGASTWGCMARQGKLLMPILSPLIFPITHLMCPSDWSNAIPGAGIFNTRGRLTWFRDLDMRWKEPTTIPHQRKQWKAAFKHFKAPLVRSCWLVNKISHFMVRGGEESNRKPSDSPLGQPMYWIARNKN